MKKGLSLIMAAAMLLTAFSFAYAGEMPEEPAPDLFDVWDYGDESPSWIASAIPVSEGILIAPPGIKDLSPEQLAVSDGEHTWQTAAVVPDGKGRFTLVFYDPGETAARYGCWPLMPWGSSIPASSCTVRFGDNMGSRINRGVLAAEDITMEGKRCMLLTLSDTAPAGSPVLTSDGMLAGIVIAEWAEGFNRVLMLPAEGIAESVTDVAELLAGLPEWSEPPQGLTVTMDQNRVTINWEEMPLPETKEGTDVYMVLVDTGNNYLNSFIADGNGREITLLLTPGRFYIAGPVVSAGRPDTVPESYAAFFVPQGEQLSEFSFKPVLTAIAEAPEGGLKEGEQPVPVTEVTEELLRSGRAYFYSHSSYEVTEEISNRSLLVTLTDPDGNNYRYESGWTYSPDYMTADIWSLPLRETGLTAAMDENGYPAGVYQIAYYVDGFLADAFEFELKK